MDEIETRFVDLHGDVYAIVLVRINSEFKYKWPQKRRDWITDFQTEIYKQYVFLWACLVPRVDTAIKNAQWQIINFYLMFSTKFFLEGREQVDDAISTESFFNWFRRENADGIWQASDTCNIGLCQRLSSIVIHLNRCTQYPNEHFIYGRLKNSIFFWLCECDKPPELKRYSI